MLTSPATKPPSPETDATALLGNRSVAIVNTIVDHAWWAPQAIAISATASRGSCSVPATITAGDMTSARPHIVPLRAAFTDHPRVISADDIQPAARQPI